MASPCSPNALHQQPLTRINLIVSEELFDIKGYTSTKNQYFKNILKILYIPIRINAIRNRRHCRSIMDRIALQIPKNLTENIRQGQRAQGRLQKLINREKLETHLRHTIKTTVAIDNESEHSIDSEDEQQNGEEKPNLDLDAAESFLKSSETTVPNDNESEHSIDSEDEQQNEEDALNLNLDAAKSFLKSSDALLRLKDEIGDFINPFASKAIWKKILWIDGQQVYFELPDTVPQRTRIDILKMAFEQYLKMPIIWWPFKQPRRCLSSNKFRVVLPCVSKKIFFGLKVVLSIELRSVVLRRMYNRVFF